MCEDILKKAKQERREQMKESGIEVLNYSDSEDQQKEELPYTFKSGQISKFLAQSIGSKESSAVNFPPINVRRASILDNLDSANERQLLIQSPTFESSLAVTRVITPKKKEPRPNFIEEFKKAKIEGTFDTHMTKFTEKARQTQQKREEALFDATLKSSVIRQIADKQPESEGQKFDKACNELSRTLRINKKSHLLSQRPSPRDSSPNAELINEMVRTTESFNKIYPAFRTGATPT